MSIRQAIFLGLVQGLAEFLPVSSSGHLVLLQRVLGVDMGGAETFFDIILHVGTLLAVCVAFRKDVANIFKRPYKTLLYLVAATLPAATAGLLLDDLIDGHIVRGKLVGVFLAIFFAVTAAALFFTELYAKRARAKLPLTAKPVMAMGFAQAVALFPGISRSGSTIAAGTLAGGSAEEVASFSFLMSIPVILGSFAVSLIKGLAGGEIGAAFALAGAGFGWCVAAGLITSALSGLVAIKVMLSAVKRADYKWFSLYLALLSAVCITLHFLGLFN